MDSNDFDVDEKFSVLSWKFIGDIHWPVKIFKRNPDETISVYEKIQLL